MSCSRGNKALRADNAPKVIDDLHRKISQLQAEQDFSSRAACHLPTAERRATIAPTAGVSISRAMHAPRDRAKQRLLPAPLVVVGRTRSAEPARPGFHEHPVYGSGRLQVTLLREGISATASDG